MSIYVIDLKKVAPFGDSSQSCSGLGGGGIGGGGGGMAFQHGQSFRKSFNKERPPGGVRQSQIKINHDTIESDEKSSTETEDDGIIVVEELNHYHNVFQPRGRECKSRKNYCTMFLRYAYVLLPFCMSHDKFREAVLLTSVATVIVLFHLSSFF